MCSPIPTMSMVPITIDGTVTAIARIVASYRNSDNQQRYIALAKTECGSPIMLVGVRHSSRNGSQALLAWESCPLSDVSKVAAAFNEASFAADHRALDGLVATAGLCL